MMKPQKGGMDRSQSTPSKGPPKKPHKKQHGPNRHGAGVPPVHAGGGAMPPNPALMGGAPPPMVPGALPPGAGAGMAMGGMPPGGPGSIDQNQLMRAILMAMQNQPNPMGGG